jgi:alkanesulfonate monooxygenase SsuD/methylene tetrahydromethanopterin reductase-like flavin-dependent oxidoreductase (luciferase family)
VRFADEYNTPFPTVEEARERRAAVDAAATAAGREPLRFSMMTGCVVGRDAAEVRERVDAFRRVSGRDDAPPLCGTVDEVADRLRAYERVGVERAMLQHLHHEDVEMVAVLGELAAAVAG